MTRQTHPPGQLSLREKIAQQWTRFSDAELDQIGNNPGRLVAALQKKYGLPMDQAERQVRRFVRRAWDEHCRSEWLAG